MLGRDKPQEWSAPPAAAGVPHLLRGRDARVLRQGGLQGARLLPVLPRGLERPQRARLGQRAARVQERLRERRQVGNLGRDSFKAVLPSTI